MKSGEDGEVRTCRPKARLGLIFYENVETNAVIAK